MAKKPKSAKSVIMSFRITEDIEELLAKKIESKAVMNGESTRKLARRVVVDFAKDRVKYTNPADYEQDRDAIEAGMAELAGSSPAPVKRGRSRTRKASAAPEVAVAEPVAAATSEPAPVVKRGRGRPRKNPVVS